MGDKPREEILVAPEFAMFIFGDGYFALVQGSTEGETDDGEKIVDFVIKPSQLLRKRYDIKDSMLNRNMNMTFRVKKKDLIPMNQFDDANKKWIYIKTFNHDDTEMSKPGWALREQLAEEQKKNKLLEGQIIWQADQIQLAKTNPAEYIMQGAEVFEKVSSKMADLIKGKSEKED